MITFQEALRKVPPETIAINIKRHTKEFSIYALVVGEPIITICYGQAHDVYQMCEKLRDYLFNNKGEQKPFINKEGTIIYKNRSHHLIFADVVQLEPLTVEKPIVIEHPESYTLTNLINAGHPFNTLAVLDPIIKE